MGCVTDILEGRELFPSVFISDSWLLLSRQKERGRVVFFLSSFVVVVVVLKK